MQLIKERGDVIRFFLEKDESCSVVLYSLKDFDRRIRETDEKRVTVVNAGQNKRLDCYISDCYKKFSFGDRHAKLLYQKLCCVGAAWTK